jgi:hypothetical protein
MNAESIATYIANLEKENAELKARLQKCEEERAILEYENMLHYVEVSDDESVVSDSDEDFFVSYNQSLADAFQTLADEEENEFKKAVYERASDIIYHLDYKVTNGDQLSHVYGIGNSLRMKTSPNNWTCFHAWKKIPTKARLTRKLLMLSANLILK